MGFKYYSTLRKTPFKFHTQAKYHAEKKIGKPITWGLWQNNGCGEVTMTGKTDNEADDIIVITQRKV